MQAERRYRESSEVLGCGAFGVVRRATDLCTGAPCVVKRVPFASGSAERESHWSVLEEARLLRWLHHPNICRISDYWESNRNGLELCLVLELCEGGDLKTRLRCANGPLAPREGASIGQQLLRALQYCHARRVLHRDVKPANVLLARDGSVRLSDFGVSRALPPGLALASTLAGSPAYMAPEIHRGTPYSSAADIWSLGCTLHECSCLRPAFSATHPAELRTLVLAGRPSSKLPPGLDPGMRGFIGAMLSVEVARRSEAAELLRSSKVRHLLRDLPLQSQAPRKLPPLPAQLAPRATREAWAPPAAAAPARVEEPPPSVPPVAPAVRAAPTATPAAAPTASVDGLALEPAVAPTVRRRRSREAEPSPRDPAAPPAANVRVKLRGTSPVPMSPRRAARRAAARARAAALRPDAEGAAALWLKLRGSETPAAPLTRRELRRLKVECERVKAECERVLMGGGRAEGKPDVTPAFATSAEEETTAARPAVRPAGGTVGGTVGEGLATEVLTERIAEAPPPAAEEAGRTPPRRGRRHTRPAWIDPSEDPAEADTPAHPACKASRGCSPERAVALTPLTLSQTNASLTPPRRRRGRTRPALTADGATDEEPAREPVGGADGGTTAATAGVKMDRRARRQALRRAQRMAQHGE